jgi:hypothetical protein
MRLWVTTNFTGLFIVWSVTPTGYPYFYLAYKVGASGTASDGLVAVNNVSPTTRFMGFYDL